MLEDIVVGKTIGAKSNKFEIIKDPNKAGAFGKIFFARNLKTNEEVAIKILKDQLNKTKLIKDFINEGKLTKAIPAHKNIVQTYDAGFDSENNIFYITMELMKYDLNEYLSTVDYSFNSIVNIIFNVGDALIHAHSKDIIYCDLHQGNILFDNKGIAKLADFGLAEIKRDSDFFKEMSKKNAIESACLNFLSEEDEKESDWRPTGIVNSAKMGLKDIAIPSITHSAPEVLAGMIKGKYRDALSKSSDIYSFAHLSMGLLELVNDVRLKKILEKSTNGRKNDRHSSMAELVKEIKNYNYYFDELSKFYTSKPSKLNDITSLKISDYNLIHELAREAKKNEPSVMDDVVKVLKNIDVQQSNLYKVTITPGSHSQKELDVIRTLCNKMKQIEDEFGPYK